MIARSCADARAHRPLRAPGTAPDRPAAAQAGPVRPAAGPACAGPQPARTAHSYAWPDAYARKVSLRKNLYPLSKGRA
ncbi:hypothetical protein GCM10009731_54680 [Streptomyces globosus]